MVFVDTNVLIYSVLGDPDDAAKQQRADQILDAVDYACSVQVIQEFYTQATRATRACALTHDEAVAFVERLSARPVQAMTVAIVRAAMSTRTRFQISYWDAAILEAARALGCATVLSEDLDEATDYGGVRVENPFRDC